LLSDNEDNTDEERVLNLVSTYAYDRKKHLEKQIKLGEGLVGTCAIEGESIYITDIPDNYINITSGLGGSNPKSLLLVPLKTDDELTGVIEIASFNELEKYQIDFVEKIAKTIAVSIITVKINERTAYLLEQTRQQAEEMQAQEEEMRQNLEELQATQEEADRKAKEMESFISSLKESNYYVEYDINGTITDVNDKLLNLLEIRRQDAIGLHHKDYLILTDEQKKLYEEFWNDLKNGISKKIIFKVEINNKEYVFNENYIPIKNVDNEVYKIIKISNLQDDFKKYQN
jgi:PAS domain-containing protein